MSSSDPGNGRFALACGCAMRCTILYIERLEFKEDPATWYFDFFTRRGERSSLWGRIKLAWNVLLRRDHFCDVLLWSDEEIAPLRDFLNNHILEKTS